jgi:hypothetical protein
MSFSLNTDEWKTFFERVLLFSCSSLLFFPAYFPTNFVSVWFPNHFRLFKPLFFLPMIISNLHV